MRLQEAIQVASPLLLTYPPQIFEVNARLRLERDNLDTMRKNAIHENETLTLKLQDSVRSTRLYVLIYCRLQTDALQEELAKKTEKIALLEAEKNELSLRLDEEYKIVNDVFKERRAY